MRNHGCWHQALRLAILLSIVFLFGCERGNEYVSPPPPPVTVAQPMQKNVINYTEFTGNTKALKTVELRARVKGFLEKINFEGGADVEEGQLLFVIDPRPFKAALDQAKADLAAKQAEFVRAETEYKRNKRLLALNAASERQVVNSKAARDKAQAAVAVAQALVQEAELNYSYTHIMAPISGVISRYLVDVGNLVGASENTLLATIYKFDPIYAYFNVSERELLELMGKYPEKRTDRENKRPKVYLALANETDYPHEGEIDYVDPYVDPDTGTIQVRAIFPNSRKIILPGMFVRIRMPIEKIENALLVTERALGSDQSGHFLLVIDAENTVEKRPVELGPLVDGMRVIMKGLEPNDRVIISGLQRARPGHKVAPKEVESSSQQAAPQKAESPSPPEKNPPDKPAQSPENQADKQ